MRLIFMGTPDFAVPSLAALINHGHDICAVFTQPDKPAGRGKQLQQPSVKSFALAHGIPVHQPAKIKTNEEVRHIFEQIAPDVCVVAAYGKILPPWMLRIPRLGCINVHASLLPKYRGAAPINWAIANGETETGVTIMQMDEGMDTGPMLAKRAIRIGEDETAQALSERLANLGAELLTETLPRVERGNVIPEPQNDSLGTYAPMLKREHGIVDWDMAARQIANRVRAFQPWPGSYTWFRTQRVTIWRASSGEESASSAFGPGTIILIDDAGIAIRCGAGTALRVEELQVEGRRRMSSRDFTNGFRVKIGDRFCAE